MILLLRIYYRQLFQVLIFSILLIWALSSTIMLSKSEVKIVPIKVSNEEVLEILPFSDSVENVFLVNMIRAYIGYCYNYDIKTFDKNMTKCSDMMSKELWGHKTGELTRAVDSLKKEKQVFITSIDSIKKQSDGKYVVNLSSTKMSNQTQSDLKIKVTLNIQKIKRYLENPWGYEVQNVEETLL